MKDQEQIPSGGDRKKAKRGAGEQLRFGFFTEETDASTAVDRPPSPEGPDQIDGFVEIVDSVTEWSQSQVSDLVRTVTAARTALLEVPVHEVDTHLPQLLEFCEATLTRALDVVQKRAQGAFSDEEYCSLRGIGQAHWLLVERQSREK